MDREQFNRVISEEQLKGYLVNHKPETKGDREICLCLWEEEGEWHTVEVGDQAKVDERTHRSFVSEEQALTSALDETRFLKKLYDLFYRWDGLQHQ